ncbi:hypothetical protein DdX_19004 [Ditylenchus destructor]|uniref:Uncharacterized protein n=1 Tax=Ditylenchus destructor TaxID=166010 RepID=A0AAD4MK54_9BILA|nr:hypothetical protein DdX_19004 [Ditylenchus destructor]
MTAVMNYRATQNALNVGRDRRIHTDTQTTVNQSVVDSAPVFLTSLSPIRIPYKALPNTIRLSHVDSSSEDIYSGMKPTTTNMPHENFCENKEELYMGCAEYYDYVGEILTWNGARRRHRLKEATKSVKPEIQAKIKFQDISDFFGQEAT